MQNDISSPKGIDNTPSLPETIPKQGLDNKISSHSSSSSSSKNQIQKKNNLGSLCDLFRSEYFTIDMLMEYLNKKEDQGIIDFLVNLLFNKKYVSQAFFYLPQLCTLIKLKHYHESLEQFIIIQSTQNIKFAVCAIWLLDSYSIDDPDYPIKFIDRLETNLINGVKTKHSINEDISNDVFINKRNKLEHFDLTLKVYLKLKSLCEKLFKIQTKPELLKEEQNTLITKCFNACNRTIDHMLPTKDNDNTSNKSSSNYFGFVLPFDSKDKEELVIVNFLVKYTRCFNTKARVPLKIVVECINPNESEDIEEQIESSIDEEEKEKQNLQEYTSIESFNKKMDNVEEERKAKEIIEAVKYDNAHPGLINQGNGNDNDNHEGESVILQTISNLEVPDPFEITWEASIQNIKENSRFRKFNSLTIKTFIAKANDDLRQELMTMQLIKKFEQIFKEANIPLHLHPYEIVITSGTSGLIEFLPDTISIDGLKKMLPPKYTLDKFYHSYFQSNFINAQKNFCESLAAYSLIAYLIAIKDRHNGNILFDKNGNIIQIDFGFILGISPGGNLNFENAPFKMTKEYIRILGGENSEVFYYFKSIFLRGLLEARKHINTFTNIIETMAEGSKMPCFAYSTSTLIIDGFKERFMIGKTENEIIAMVDDLVYRSCNSWRTGQYDLFQKLTNGILP